jgi:biofilm PGA synthesis N-glycosyltransferase PgaC
LALLLIALLVVFSARRYLFILTSLLPDPGSLCDFTPPVSVLVSARNEQRHLPGLLASFDRLDYPAEQLHFVLVDDGSTDATGRLQTQWAASRPNATVLRLDRPEGKARALNRALAVAPPSELIAVYDADVHPHPASLRQLAAAFADPAVGAAAGYRRPANWDAGLVAAYAALESWVHQLVTQAAKDRLRMNPTTLGAHCLYRRSALNQVGGFPPGSFSEDIEVSLALVARGWKTRFLRNAPADSFVAESLDRFWNQRARWTRGLYGSARQARGLESWLVSAGYLDRIVFLLSCAALWGGWLSPLWLAVYLSAPLAAVLAGLYNARPGWRAALYSLAAVGPMFLADVAATCLSTAGALLRRRLPWRTG